MPSIHEHQAKDYFKQYGIPILYGQVVYNESQIDMAIDDVMSRSESDVVVVKAQIHAGGRGLGGGVKVCKSIEDAQQRAREILGMNLVTKQTGPEGKIVRRVYIESGCDIQDEYYLSLVVDRANECLSFVVSTEGGMNIEDVAHDSPEKILNEKIDPINELNDQNISNIISALNVHDSLQIEELSQIVKSLYKFAQEKDVNQIEINPLVRTKRGNFIALDAKVEFDDNATYKHPDVLELHDPNEVNSVEFEASSVGLNYIQVDGNIGCMVNGAGLAMATMDTVKHCGGNPANFLDVGGGANQEMVEKALKMITSDDSVNSIFVNIFGGIVKCDMIATAIVEGVKSSGISLPMIVRLQGTNSEEGRRIVMESGLGMIYVDDFLEAAKKAVKLAS